MTPGTDSEGGEISTAVCAQICAPKNTIAAFYRHYRMPLLCFFGTYMRTNGCGDAANRHIELFSEMTRVWLSLKCNRPERKKGQAPRCTARPRDDAIIRELTKAGNAGFSQDFPRMLNILLGVEFQGRNSRVGFLALCEISALINRDIARFDGCTQRQRRRRTGGCEAIE